MSLYLIGTDYRSVDISRREEICRLRPHILSYWQKFFLECAILTTCNRVEIYGYGAVDNILPLPDQKWYFLRRRRDVLRHAFRLAVGLDSQIQAEIQIIDQLNSWVLKLPPAIARFWQSVLKEALKIRDEAGLNAPERNLAVFVYEDIGNYRVDYKPRIVVLGTGKVAGLLAEYRPENAWLYFAAHKNFTAARILANKAKATVVSLESLPELLLEADFLISATSSPHYILQKEQVAKIAHGRGKPLYVYDLAIPRDIDPDARSIRGVVLKNLDDLALISDAFNRRISEKVLFAQYLIDERVKDYEAKINYRFASEPAGLASS